MEGDNVLNIEMECIKGVIFIRFKNEKEINKNYKKISEMIKDNQINNIVFNLKNVNKIDRKGIKLLNYNYSLCKRNNGSIYFCDMKKDIENILLKNYLPITNNELTALNLFNI